MSIGITKIGASVAAKTWHVTAYTTAGTYTWNKNNLSGDLAFIRGVGAGGGGGRPADGSTTDRGQGGHSGVSGERWVDIANVTSATITVGAGGAGATASGTAGSVGADTTFGTIARFPGGAGGGREAAQTTPTMYSTATLYVYGGVQSSIPSGTPSTSSVGFMHPLCAATRPNRGSDSTYQGGGPGAGSRYGPGGTGGNGVVSGAGNVGSAPASGNGGGGGGGSGGSTTSGNGGAGSAGAFEIWEYY